MDQVSQSDIEVLKSYAKPIVCMRAARKERKLGLILGAGVSKSFGLPDWGELLDQLAIHPKVRGEGVDHKKGMLTARAEILYQHYYRQRRDAAQGSGTYPDDKQIKGEWSEIIRGLLYGPVRARFPNWQEMDRSHAFLGEYLQLILEATLTINYNFDSCLEMMLSARQRRGGETIRRYETVFEASIPFRSTSGIIYHPNGYLPENELEGFSDELVFSEKEFGDQLLDNITGRYTSFAHHLSKNTCLFLGLSFTDENLRHLLRRNAVNNPGHYHYCVQWLSPDKPLNDEYKAALVRYRIEVYNLITLFLADEGLAALGRLLTMDYVQLRSVAEQAEAQLVWVYYLTGIPGIGKTTVCRYMGSLKTYDEWTEEPLPLLAKPHVALSDKERRAVDEWVANQFALKNQRLLKENEGVFLIDRAPLDPLSFAEIAKVRAKARQYKQRLYLGDTHRQLRKGCIILLTGDCREVSSRLARRRGQVNDIAYLEGLQTVHRLIYSAEGRKDVDTIGYSLQNQVRAVARVIHAEDHYREMDLQGVLNTIAAKGISHA